MHEKISVGRAESILGFLGKATRKFLFLPAILVIIGLLAVNITDRFLFDGLLGLSWVEEICVIVMVWLVFLSTFAIDNDALHIKVQVINLPPRLSEILEDAAVILFVGFLVWSTWSLVPRMFSKYPALGWPIHVGYFSILVGGSLTILCKIGKHLLRSCRK